MPELPHAAAPVHLTPYRPRHVAFLGFRTCDGMTLKVYGLTRDGGRPPSTLVDASVTHAFAWLQSPRPSSTVAGVTWTDLPAHGAGSLIIHVGREAIFVVLDVWVDENMLRHHVWAAAHEPPVRFASLAPSDIAICVWELAIVQHERAAWLRHVLTPAGEGDLRAYLADVHPDTTF